MNRWHSEVEGLRERVGVAKTEELSVRKGQPATLDRVDWVAVRTISLLSPFLFQKVGSEPGFDFR